MIKYIVIFIAFITGCDYGHPKTQLLQVEFLGGYSPYDFENSIEGRYLIKLDKKKLLEDILIKLGRDHKLNDAESAFLDSAADIKGEFSSSVKESQYTTKFLFFVLSVDFGDETAIQPNAIGLYFNEKSQIIAINCPPTEEIICSELSYPKSRGWIWRYGNQHKEIKGDALNLLHFNGYIK